MLLQALVLVTVKLATAMVRLALKIIEVACCAVKLLVKAVVATLAKHTHVTSV